MLKQRQLFACTRHTDGGYEASPHVLTLGTAVAGHKGTGFAEAWF